MSQENEQPNNVCIYRFKCTQSFMNALYEFSKIHQYDDRKSFKDAWEQWLQDNIDLVEVETRRLQEMEYQGDVLDKMYKSARYYFRKKSSVKPAPKERRKYTSVHKELLDAMDQDIASNKNRDDYKPSNGFSHFCNLHQEELKTEINRLVDLQLTSDEILQKIKKTYKNRYFMSITK